MTHHISFVDRPARLGDYTGHNARNPSQAESTTIRARERDTKEFDSWYQTAEGRRVLADDKRFFTKKFGDHLLATRNGDQIKLTGREGHIALSVTYPVSIGQETILLVLKDRDREVLEISCHLEHRELGFVAAIAAANEL